MQELLGKTMKSFSEGSIVKGRILQRRTNEVLIDIGYKSEGVISLSEFEDADQLDVGSEVEVLLERLEKRRTTSRSPLSTFFSRSTMSIALGRFDFKMRRVCSSVRPERDGEPHLC